MKKLSPDYIKSFSKKLHNNWTSPMAQQVKNPSAVQETQVQPLGREDPLE